LNEQFLLTPSVEAGRPIIFDYRLGHHGLAKTTKDCCPIVYCTYAPRTTSNNSNVPNQSTKEFKDIMNFSRKRYHKMGELINKKPTRDERNAKRTRQMEDLHERLIMETKILSNDDQETNLVVNDVIPLTTSDSELLLNGSTAATATDVISPIPSNSKVID
jgi:hypothetical protein